MDVEISKVAVTGNSDVQHMPGTTLNFTCPDHVNTPGESVHVTGEAQSFGTCARSLSQVSNPAVGSTICTVPGETRDLHAASQGHWALAFLRCSALN